MQSSIPESTGSYLATVAVIAMVIFAIYSMAHVWGWSVQSRPKGEN